MESFISFPENSGRDDDILRFAGIAAILILINTLMMIVSLILILILLVVVGLLFLPAETTFSSGEITYYANNSTG